MFFQVSGNERISDSPQAAFSRRVGGMEEGNFFAQPRSQVSIHCQCRETERGNGNERLQNCCACNSGGYNIYRFAITNQQLGDIVDNSELYKRLNGAQGIGKKLDVHSFEHGILGSENDIKERVLEFGSNKYEEKPVRGYFLYLWDACQDLTLVILAVCAVIALAVGIPTEGISQGWYDGVGILVSVLLVVLITATSDYRQSLQFQVLENEKKKIDVEVLRAGCRQKISIYDLVVGDIVFLSTGDQVPADGLFISGYSLIIGQSSLTGESEPVHPSCEKPFLFAGTMVMNGSGKMLVTAVGMRTEWGKLMSKLSEGGDNETPLQVRLNGVATVVGKIGLAFALLTFSVLIIRFLVARFAEGFENWKMTYLLDIVNYFAIAVTILVVAVPEGLPLAVTLSLAYAMKQMMDDKALIRNLAACETMGSATYICTDKTGTLTTNKMAVIKVYCAGHNNEAENLHKILREKASELLIENVFLNTSGDIVECEDEHKVYGSPTETALLNLGLFLGGSYSAVKSSCEMVKVAPFNSFEKKMSVLVKRRDGRYRSFCKGAAEIVLKACDHVMDEMGASNPLEALERQKLEGIVRAYSQEALRTLCLAYVDHDSMPECDEVCPKVGLTLVAIVGIKDPVRPGVKDAVDLCLKAGIKVCMVTGDNLETAKAIAHECNILTDGLAVEGPVFRRWSSEETMENLFKLQVIARSSPSDKFLLVERLQAQQEVVAVTGDGTNDAPALHAADIGLAMGISGTEVAKSTADAIILDDNFSSIVKIAKWGRSVYTNIQKFVQFQLTVNIVALTINFVSACATGDAPLTAVQLLWVNLIMDTLGALALATEAPYDALMERPPVGRQGSFITNMMWRNILGQAVYQLIILWVLQFKGKTILHITGDHANETLNTLIFNSFVFCQVFNEINSREMEKVNVFGSILTNNLFLLVLLFTVIFQAVIVEFLGTFASTVPLSAEHWAISVALGFCSLLVAAVVKLIPVPSKPIMEFFRSSKAKGDAMDDGVYHRLPSS
ncbi:hypothetical protein KP509_10G051700 [Ceratopteris richardii]|uniref:Calcium-transporting ATPase n=1 Tax=Ceratopteris richardii TaxID=49495 RepID=A0A8T2U1Y6_CERRI|nr:hypothetical protein KP509_10G051700 [Ceratopteris richardii]